MCIFKRTPFRWVEFVGQPELNNHNPVQEIMKRTHFIILLILIPFITQIRAQYTETEVKAAYLERFTRFIDWPPANCIASNQFVIGVMDGDVTERVFSSLYASQKIKERPVKIINIKSKEEFEKLCACNMVYITDKWSDEIDAIIKSMTGRPVLLVGECKKHLHCGVMINFYTDHNHLHFDLNPDLLERAGFQVDYRLLDYASNKK